MPLPDPQKVAARIVEMYGGRQAVIDAMERQLAEFNLIWDQDTDRIGRVLRAHLAVEHFVGQYLAAKNPNLGALEKTRLSYSQKVELLNSSDRMVAAILPRLRLLGSIRNRIAHRLRVELTKKDEEGFLGIELFRAMRHELHKHQSVAPAQNEVDSALLVLEEFAKLAASWLHSSLHPDSNIYSAALAEFSVSGDHKQSDA